MYNFFLLIINRPSTLTVPRGWPTSRPLQPVKSSTHLIAFPPFLKNPQLTNPLKFQPLSLPYLTVLISSQSHATKNPGENHFSRNVRKDMNSVMSASVFVSWVFSYKCWFWENYWKRFGKEERIWRVHAHGRNIFSSYGMKERLGCGSDVFTCRSKRAEWMRNGMDWLLCIEEKEEESARSSPTEYQKAK